MSEPVIKETTIFHEFKEGASIEMTIRGIPELGFVELEDQEDGHIVTIHKDGWQMISDQVDAMFERMEQQKDKDNVQNHMV